MSSLTRKLLSFTPLVRYVKAVEEGTRKVGEEIEHQGIITEIHAKRADYYFYEKNGVTPLVVGLIRGDYK